MVEVRHKSSPHLISPESEIYTLEQNFKLMENSQIELLGAGLNADGHDDDTLYRIKCLNIMGVGIEVWPFKVIKKIPVKRFKWQLCLLPLGHDASMET